MLYLYPIQDYPIYFMENQSSLLIRFHGKGEKFFGIQLVNVLLTLVTLGFYYPWAKAARLQYLYGETEFAGSRFHFHGTGKEMFIGYLKALGIFFALYVVLIALMATNHPIMAIVFYIAVCFF